MASLAAVMMSSFETPGRPYRMFSAMVVANRTGSCSTIPIKERNHWMFRPLMSWPSNVTWSERKFTRISERCSPKILQHVKVMILYHSFFRVIESLNELNRGALPSTTGTHKCCCLSWLNLQIKLIEDLWEEGE